MSEEFAVLIWSVVGLSLVWLAWVSVRAWHRRRAMYPSIQADVAERFRRQQAMASRDLDELLDQLADGRWAVHAFPNRDNPLVIAYTYDYGVYADVVILRSADSASAFRTPSTGDVLAPETVVWLWSGDADMALGALFTLPKPGEPGAPYEPQPIPPGVGLHPSERERLTYRPRQHRWS